MYALPLSLVPVFPYFEIANWGLSKVGVILSEIDGRIQIVKGFMTDMGHRTVEILKNECFHSFNSGRESQTLSNCFGTLLVMVDVRNGLTCGGVF